MPAPTPPSLEPHAPPTPNPPPLSRRPLSERAQETAKRRDLRPLLLLVLLAGAAWGFVELGDAVSDGDTLTWDEQLLLAFRADGDPDDPIGSHAVESAVRDVTALGSVTVIVFLTLTTVGFFLLSRRPRMAAYVVAAVGGGMALSYGLKFLYDRTRPDLLPPEVLPGDPSFPSGHAAAATIVYLTLAVVLARSLPRHEMKVYVVGLGALLALAVGVSRVYLGVHWPTDVLAGWTIGAAWALLCWQAERMLQRRGLVEGEAAPA